MTALLHRVDPEVVRTLVLTLLHTVWQAAAVLAVLYGLLRILPAGRANLRYGLCTLGLAAIVIGGAATWAVLNHAPVVAVVDLPAPVSIPADSAAAPAVATVSPIVATTAPPPAPRPAESHDTDWTIAVGITWLAGVTVMLGRMVAAIAGVRRLRRRASPVNDEPITEAVARIAARMGLRRAVSVMRIDDIGSPAVLGIVRPALLLPASMLSGLPAEHLQAILAHELAHIRRWDYLVNLGQMLVESLLFFNPAAWWISRQMRIEREACCDAMAVAATGQPVGYAEALAGWAERLHSLSPLPAVAPAFADRRGGVLLERVRRILLPGERPGMRLSWPALVVVIVTGALLLVAMWRGTGLAVALAAEILSPEQRMQQLQAAAERFAARQVPTSDNPTLRVVLSGTLESADGRPLPANGHLLISSEGPASSVSSSGQWQDGRFEVRIKPGIIWIMAEADGFAPAVFGPLTGEPGAVLEDIVLTFGSGFPAEVHAKDEDGRTVADTEIALSVIFRGTSSNRPHRTDDKGVIHIPHASDLPYRLEISAGGFQRDEVREVRLKEGQPYEWTVRRSRPTTLTITGTDGAPVANALLRLYAEEGGGSPRLHAWDGPKVGHTDANGRIEIDTLIDGRTYTLLLEAPDGRRQLIRDVRAGAEARTVQLDPEITVTGKITGDLSRLEVRNGKPSVFYTLGAKWNHSVHFSPTKPQEVEIRDGVGHFAIRHLIPTQLDLRAGDVSRRLEIIRSVDDLVIDLGDPKQEERSPVGTRTVEMVIRTPPGHPPASGVVRLNVSDPQSKSQSLQILKLVDGRARCEVPFGSTLSYHLEQVLGYWFDSGPFEKWTAVPEGEGVHTIEIDAIPAGAIVGRAFDADGLPLENVGISLYVAQEPPLPGNARFENVHNIRPVDGRFMISPVPFGGRYAVGISNRHAYIFSEPVSIDVANPIQEVELRLVKGVDVTVGVEDSDGKPIANVPVRLGYRSPYSSHGVSPNPATDTDGRVVFQNVNPNAPGDGYTASFAGRRDYLPASVPVTLDGRPVVLRLTRGGVVRGQVVDAETGWPIPGAEVLAVPLDWREGDTNVRREAEQKTDADGRFRFSTLDPGRPYGFSVSDAAMSRIPSEFVAIADSGKDLKIPITLSQRSTLTPVKPAKE